MLSSQFQCQVARGISGFSAYILGIAVFQYTKVMQGFDDQQLRKPRTLNVFTRIRIWLTKGQFRVELGVPW